MLFFILGSFLLGIFWVLIFFVFSFIGYLVVLLLSQFGAFVNISGDNNVWLLFFVVIGISACVKLGSAPKIAVDRFIGSV